METTHFAIGDRVWFTGNGTWERDDAWVMCGIVIGSNTHMVNVRWDNDIESWENFNDIDID
jgi:hypothetical protein